MEYAKDDAPDYAPFPAPDNFDDIYEGNHEENIGEKDLIASIRVIVNRVQYLTSPLNMITPLNTCKFYCSQPFRCPTNVLIVCINIEHTFFSLGVSKLS